MKRIKDNLHDCLFGLTQFYCANRSFAVPRPQTTDGLREYNDLLRLGLVIRAKMDTGDFAYTPSAEGISYMLDTEPGEFEEK